jgi:hypothetical protein
MSDAGAPPGASWTAVRPVPSVLAGAWYAAAGACAALALYLWAGNWIGVEGFTLLLGELSQAYLPYLALVTWFAFGAGGAASRPLRRASFLAAGALWAGFTLLVPGAVLSIALDVRNVEEVARFIELVSSFVSPFIASALVVVLARAQPAD